MTSAEGPARLPWRISGMTATRTSVSRIALTATFFINSRGTAWLQAATLHIRRSGELLQKNTTHKRGLVGDTLFEEEPSAAGS